MHIIEESNICFHQKDANMPSGREGFVGMMSFSEIYAWKHSIKSVKNNDEKALNLTNPNTESKQILQ